MVSRSAVNTPREAFGLRDVPTILATNWLDPLPDLLAFDPPIVFPLVEPDTFGGRRPYTPLNFRKHIPSRPARGGE
jgi:hypothetical protein